MSVENLENLSPVLNVVRTVNPISSVILRNVLMRKIASRNLHTCSKRRGKSNIKLLGKHTISVQVEVNFGVKHTEISAQRTIPFLRLNSSLLKRKV